MINAALIRSQIGQFEQLNAAASAFRTKYNALAGDMLSSQATQLGFAQRTGGLGFGDGNGIIQSVGGSTRYGDSCAEPVLFVQDLGTAGLISQLPAGVSSGACLGYSGSGSLSFMLLVSKLSSNLYVTPYYSYYRGKHYYLLSSPPTIVIASTGDWTVGTSSPGLSPPMAMQFDTKLDDGLPQSGMVLASDRAWALTPAGVINLANGAAKCMNNDVYNTAYGKVACDLNVYTSW